MYGKGLGISKDYKLSFQWFLKAAEQDDTESQINLGMMCSVGEGTPKDLVESYKWFTLALTRGDLEEAQENELRDNVEWLEKKMTNQQIDEAKKRALQWKPFGA
jgi:TPR repeat protein